MRDRKKAETPLLPPDAGKLPPQAPDVEQVVLGQIMLEADCLSEVSGFLKAEHFYVPANQLVYEAIMQQADADEPVNIITIVQRLKRNETLDIVGGPFYIAQLTNKVSSGTNVEYHGRIILQKHLLREIARVGSSAWTEGMDDSNDPIEEIERLQSSLASLQDMITSGKKGNIAEAVKQVFADYDSKTSPAIPTGITSLDNITQGGFRPTEMVVLAARPGMGKCHGAGTKVLMYDGRLLEVENVRSGDLLMGPDSKPRTVLGTTHGTGELFQVTQTMGIAYVVNEPHVLSLVRSGTDGTAKDGDITNIAVSDWLGRSEKFKTRNKGYKVPVEFRRRQVPLPAYYLGLWLGDGNAANQTIHKPDAEIRDYLNDMAKGMNMRLSEGVSGPGRCPSFRIVSDNREDFGRVQKELIALGLIKNKHIPRAYLINDRTTRMELLAGLLDTDGYLGPDGTTFEIVQKDETLADDIVFLANSLGFRITRVKKLATIASTGYSCMVNRMCISGDTHTIPTRIQRKKARMRKTNKDWRRTGITVEPIGHGEYYGFELDGDHLYLLEDMTVTHNTSLALSIQEVMSVAAGRPTAMINCEMNEVLLTQRMMAQGAGVPSELIRTRSLSDNDLVRLQTYGSKLMASPVHFVEGAGMSLTQVTSTCERLAKKGVELIILDHIGLVHVSNMPKGSNRENEVGMVSRKLKQLATRLNITIVALSQLSRDVEKRGGEKRPNLADLRDSGSIEQDADMVIFIWRAEYYGIPSDQPGLTELIIAKQRNGRLGTVHCLFNPSTTAFTSTAHGSDQAPF